MIQAGRVQVNGVTVTHPGTAVDPLADRVLCDGKPVVLPEGHMYLLLNKPPGYLVSAGDPHHKRTIYDLLSGVSARVVPVGRLDLDTWGVLLLTDDGDLNYRLTHPRYGVEKTYRALVRGRPNSGVLGRLRAGVVLADGPTAPAKVRRVRTDGQNQVLELVLREGRKRQVKHMCAAVGHPVLRLERVAFGGIVAGTLKPGTWRHLAAGEVRNLKALVGLT